MFRYKEKEVKIPWHQRLLKEVIESSKSFSYKVLGKRMERVGQYERVELKLKQADMKLTPGLFMSMSLMICFAASLVSFFFYTLIFLVILAVENWYTFVFFLTVLNGLIGLFFLSIVRNSRIAKRKSEIDRELPFTLSELSILASTGLSPIAVFRRISQRKENIYMENEFKKIIYKVDIEGNDIITAISDTARETPSNHLREMLWDLANMIHEGGSLDVYLRTKADEGLNLKRTIQKEMIETLETILELYISVVLVGILIVSVAVFIIDAMGSDAAGGVDGETLLLFMSYGFLPVSVLLMIMIISLINARME